MENVEKKEKRIPQTALENVGKRGKPRVENVEKRGKPKMENEEKKENEIPQMEVLEKMEKRGIPQVEALEKKEKGKPQITLEKKEKRGPRRAGAPRERKERGTPQSGILEEKRNWEFSGIEERDPLRAVEEEEEEEEEISFELPPLPQGASGEFGDPHLGDLKIALIDPKTAPF